MLHRNYSLNTGRFYHSAVNILLSMCLTIFTLLVVYFLSHYKSFNYNLEEINKLFLDKWVQFINPKPKEHYIYVSLLLALPVISVFSVYLTNRSFSFIKTNINFIKLILLFIPCWIIMANYTKPSYLLTLFKNDSVIVLLLSFIIYLLILYRLNINYRHFQSCNYLANKFQSFLLLTQNSRLKGWLLTSSIILLVIFQSFSFRIVSVNQVVTDGAGAWSVHFQAVYYAVTQVVAGKTLLANLPAQYGLYAELLYPFFLLLKGATVYKFTFVMGVMQIIALYAIVEVLSQHIRNHTIFFITVVGLVYITGLTWVIIGIAWEPLFQISPIRFFFPAVSIYLFSRLMKNLSYMHIASFSLFFTIAIIWNLDTGFPVFGAFFAYLLSLLLFPRICLSRKQIFIRMLFSLSIAISLIILFFFYLKLKTNGADLKIVDIFKYQNIFYITGFGMLPIERGFAAPWQIICCIYVFGIGTAIYYWLDKNHSKFVELTFFISILGLGLFSYHEGRSHPWTLIAITWPAYLIIAMLLDRVIRLINLRCLPRFFFAPFLPFLFFIVVSASSFVYGLPIIMKYTYTHWSAYVMGTSTHIIENMMFMKSKLKGDQEAVIFAPCQAVYYGELGIRSPIDGPGNIEIILKEDWDGMVNQIQTKQPKHIFVKKEQGGLPKDLVFLKKNYQILDQNKEIAYLSYLR